MNTYPIEETPNKCKYRESCGLTDKITVNAKHLKLAWESDNKEELPWNKHRLENLRSLVNSGTKIDAHPQVGIHDHWNTIGVGDGRHRISHAAERNENITVAVRPEDKDRILSRISQEAQKERIRNSANELIHNV